MMVNESVGEAFRVDLLKLARDKTLEVITRAAKQIKPGMFENDAKSLVQKIQLDLGAPKSWHPPQIRFGENTLQPFGGKGNENPQLQLNDIYFIDIGPIFEFHEGDVGRAYSVGNDSEMQRCCRDVETIWHEVRNHWKTNSCTGDDLYRFAESLAKDRGWLLCLEKANGHRIADFPHTAKSRGSIDGFAKTPASDRWILEIQIRHPSRPFGAFYEDLLN